MDPYAYKSPIKSNCDEARLRVGVDILEHLYGAHHDVAMVGPSAIVSLLQALIADDEYLDREDLARKAKFLCRPDMADTVDDLISFFEGEDPRRHLWSGRDGFYRPLNGPFHDFPN